MQSLDLMVIAVYAVSVLAAGVVFSRSGVDMNSFFGAGGQAPWWLSGLSLYMSFFSAGAFVVWGGIAYQWGWVAITINWTISLGGVVTAIWIAHRWKRTGVLTAAEFLGRRLGTPIQQFYTYMHMVFLTFAAGGVLYPVSKMVAVSSPFSLTTSAIVLGAIITIYTAIGGLWAVLVTDTLQFVVLLAAVIILLPLAIPAAGGFSGFVTRAPDGFFGLTNGEFTWGFVIPYTLYHIMLVGGKWPYVQRYTSVPDERSARKVALLFAGLYLFNPVLFMLPSMLYRVVEPGLRGLETENAFILMCQRVLPPGLIGLMLAAMLSSSASCANTILNLLAAVVTNDVYKKVVHPAASQRTLVVIGRIATVVFGAAMVVIAVLVPRMGGLVEMVLTIAALSGGAIMLPPIWALLSKRLTAAGAVRATLVSLGINGFLKFAAPVWPLFKLARATEMISGVGIPLLILAGFELAAARRNTTDPGYLRVTQGSPAGAVAAIVPASALDQGRFGVQVVAIALLYIAACLVLLSALIRHSRLLVASVGFVICPAGILLWRLQQRAGARAAPASPVV